MPLSVVIGLVALLVALVCYSIGVWGPFRAKGAKKSHVIILWVGVAFDVIATMSMSAAIGWKLEPSLHTLLALLALFGMVVLTSLTMGALAKSDDALTAKLAKWGLAPWALWVVVFAWGMITRMPRG